MPKDDNLSLEDGTEIDGRWTVSKKLGQGSFGAVYLVFDKTGEFKDDMALKLESAVHRGQVLKIEVAVLQSMQGYKHACKLFARGRNVHFNFMVMSLLGPALGDLRKQAPETRFRASTALRIVFQCVKAVRDMHSVGWIHRDVKPSNFAIGSNIETRRNVFIFDFGLARRFRRLERDKKNTIMRPSRAKAGFRGTVRYCSLNAHRRLELGRHDDLVSILYMTVEFIKGSLPWTKLKEKDDVGRCKEKEDVNIYNGLPEGATLVAVHQYLYKLTYDKKPKYSTFEETLLNIIYKNKFNLEPLDWETGLVKTPKCLNTEDEDEKVEGEGEDEEPEGIEDLPVSNYQM